MAAVTSLHLLLMILFFSSQIIALNAVPITRSRNLLHETQTQVLEASETIPQEILTEDDQSWVNGRMDLESNDYPGSGANNRHLPRPPFTGRG